MEEFPWDIKLEDTWFEWEYGKYLELIKQYNSERIKLENLEHEATKPIPCKSWVKAYFYGDEPSHMAILWSEIDEYIKEQSKKGGWTYSHIETEQIDVNNDPWDDYENLTDQYTVYAIVESKEDFKESNDYQSQYKVVKSLYEEVITLKNSIDGKMKSQ
ncbi:coil containing protein [Vibrio phage 1.161.O._10N.261.48.C5]|nr:coil containing protein [Vibrio phage 1.161.O._10N.261.48.C5]